MDLAKLILVIVVLYALFGTGLLENFWGWGWGYPHYGYYYGGWRYPRRFRRRYHHRPYWGGWGYW